MRNRRRAITILAAVVGLASSWAVASRRAADPEAPVFEWWTVVNKNDLMPGTVNASNPGGERSIASTSLP